MSEYKEKIVNLETGETTFRDYTAEEIAAVEAARAEVAAKIEAVAAKEAARLAVEQKLAALGLTKEDLTALGL